MDRLAFNSVAAINEQRVSRQMTAHELANVSTVGFKRSYEVSMRALKAEGAGLETRLQPQAVGVDLIQLKPGSVMATGRELDVSMNESTVLGVVTKDGNFSFTRRGDLRVNTSGVLENGAGFPIRGRNGPITVPRGFDLSINADGSVFAKDPAQVGNAPPVLVDIMSLRDASKTPLERREDGLFQPEKNPDRDITNGGGRISLTPKALEGSNVNAMEIMIKLLDQSRSFEQQIRIIKESKTGSESGASMIKLGG